MIHLREKLKQQERNKATKSPDPETRLSVRDKLLVKEVVEMQGTAPRTCRIHFDDPDRLYQFNVAITPESGYWNGGRFQFRIDVPEEYNIMPPMVRCNTRIWHPNINEDGEVCLSLLRQNSIDSMGWAPTRKLKDVVWGLDSLFSDLLNFDDPLNVEAAEHYQRDKDGFVWKVKDYVQKYAKQR